MARRKKKSEINVFSTSAIDLFASGMGVFLILVVITLPRFKNVSEQEVKMDSETVAKLIVELNKLSQVESEFLKGLTAQMKNLKDVDSEIRKLASINRAAFTKVEGVQSVATTIQATQAVVKDLIQMIKVINQQQEQTIKKLKAEQKKVQVKSKQVKSEKKKVKNKTKTIEELKAQLKEKEDELKKGDKFVAVLLRWDTANHDVDLQVIDPSGNVHSYKGDGPRTVMSDDRAGPGGEIWYLKDPEPGKYKVNAYFHGKYGNKKKATVHATVVDWRSIQIVQPYTLGAEGKVYSMSEFEVKEDKSILPLTQQY